MRRVDQPMRRAFWTPPRCSESSRMSLATPNLPIVDLTSLRQPGVSPQPTVDAIHAACRQWGFFYVVGHGVDDRLARRLADLSRTFFAQPAATKEQLGMDLGGTAWRGYFGVGTELTQGRPDQKEGLYLGTELSDTDRRVVERVPFHGANLYPPIAGFGQAVEDYLRALTALGHLLMEGLALSLDLSRDYFASRYTADPLILFRIFHYPPLPPTSAPAPAGAAWSVGEHTDYGFLTMLWQDQQGGLQVKTQTGWVDAPPIHDSFVCNLGDMLDRITGGRYRSTPHRVRNRGRRGRLSMPFFFDPAYDAEIRPIDAGRCVVDDAASRWDGASVHQWQGTYGEYLLRKVARVFPQLAVGQLPARPPEGV